MRHHSFILLLLLLAVACKTKVDVYYIEEADRYIILSERKDSWNIYIDSHLVNPYNDKQLREVSSVKVEKTEKDSLFLYIPIYDFNCIRHGVFSKLADATNFLEQAAMHDVCFYVFSNANHTIVPRRAFIVDIPSINLVYDKLDYVKLILSLKDGHIWYEINDKPQEMDALSGENISQTLAVTPAPPWGSAYFAWPPIIRVEEENYPDDVKVLSNRSFSYSGRDINLSYSPSDCTPLQFFWHKRIPDTLFYIYYSDCRFTIKGEPLTVVYTDVLTWFVPLHPVYDRVEDGPWNRIQFSTYGVRLSP